MKRKKLLNIIFVLAILLIVSIGCNALLFVKYRNAKVEKVELSLSGLPDDIAVEKVEKAEKAETSEEWKTTEVTEGVPDSNEYDEFTVLATPENIETYLSLFSYDSDHPNETNYINTSNIYDKGWVYEERSDDYRLKYSRDSDNLLMKYPFSIRPYDLNISLDKFSITECSGKLRFISIRHVVSDEVDDMKYKREVIFSNGKRVRYNLDATTYKMKW